MNEVLTKQDMKLILKEFKGELNNKNIEYLDIDYDKVKQLLVSGPASKYLLLRDEKNSQEPLLLNNKGEYEYTINNKKRLISKEYIAAINFSSQIFSESDGKARKSHQLLEIIWSNIEKIMRGVFKRNKSIHSQLENIIVNSDTIYKKLRDSMYELKNEYDGDNTFEVVFLLPDLFVYLCRLLTDMRLPKAYKVELILAMIYLVSPIDFIPEGLIPHPLAMMDDFGMIIYIIKKGIDDSYISRETFEKHWPGDVDFFDKINELYEVIFNTIGTELLEMIRKYHKTKVKIVK